MLFSSVICFHNGARTKDEVAKLLGLIIAECPVATRESPLSLSPLEGGRKS